MHHENVKRMEIQWAINKCRFCLTAVSYAAAAAEKQPLFFVTAAVYACASIAGCSICGDRDAAM
jgi:hypothetical protein